MINTVSAHFFRGDFKTSVLALDKGVVCVSFGTDKEQPIQLYLSDEETVAAAVTVLENLIETLKGNTTARKARAELEGKL